MSSSPVPSSSAKTVAPLTGKRWSNLRMLLERSGPFCKADFVASPARLNFLQTECKILVIGAGGLGCELLKDLALMGFGDVHVIDMDTIELSNLNRQFLFRRHDIGSSKAEVAARFINARVPTCRVTPHFGKIQDFGDSFYSSFHVVVCGLDSIVARRWINGKLIGMLSYDEDGQIDPSTIIPLIDGGTEGFKGNVRVILPGYTACIECTLNLYPPQVTYPLCTIANTPRLPEHCIEYVKIIQWDKENPFHTPLDGDDPQHVSWIHDRALERANQFNIDGITYRLVQGVIKHIIPAVASTNAVVAAACATEVFKLATGSYECINNYMNFNDSDGIYTFTYEAEKSPQCLACSGAPQILDIARPDVYTLHDLITHLCDDKHFQMTSPSIATLKDGANRTLYMSIMGATHANLEQSLESLGLANGQHLNVSDPTSPNGVTVQLRYPDTNAAVQ